MYRITNDQVPMTNESQLIECRCASSPAFLLSFRLRHWSFNTTIDDGV